MNDLKLKYVEGKQVKEKNFERIFDFTDAYEAGEFQETDASDVSIIIFENPLNTHKFTSIPECYKFLIRIMGGKV